MKTTNVLFTGFVNTDVPKNAIRAAFERFDSIHMMCTTGIAHLNDMYRDYGDKVVQMTMGHFGLVPSFHDDIRSGKIEATNIPQGVFAQMIDDGPEKGFMCQHSDVGLGTFVESNGGMISPHKPNGMVEQSLFSEKGLFYCIPQPDVAVILVEKYDPIRARYIIGGEMPLDKRAAMFAAKKIIIGAYEVGDIISAVADGQYNTIPHAKVLGYTLEERPEHEQETNANNFELIDVPYNKRSMMGRALNVAYDIISEHKRNTVVNVGIGGMPELLGRLVGQKFDVDFTVESGTIGGTPRSGERFGTAINPREKVSHADMFRIYGNGCIDLSILGVGEFDAGGMVNVHDFGGRLAGTGGFMDICKYAKNIIFVASDKKLVDEVKNPTYNMQYRPTGQNVWIITETKTYHFGG